MDRFIQVSDHQTDRNENFKDERWEQRIKRAVSLQKEPNTVRLEILQIRMRSHSIVPGM